jgi:hypothetical protein
VPVGVFQIAHGHLREDRRARPTELLHTAAASRRARCCRVVHPDDGLALEREDVSDAAAANIHNGTGRLIQHDQPIVCILHVASREDEDGSAQLRGTFCSHAHCSAHTSHSRVPVFT